MKGRVLHYCRVAAAAIAIAVIAAGAWAAYKAVYLPDPAIFCPSPDPTPQLADYSPITVQNCAAGRTLRMEQGETIAVDLYSVYGVDRHTEWTLPTVSDSDVLVNVYAPELRIGPDGGAYALATYRAARPGTATISAFEHFCGGPVGCGFGVRWTVTVLVS
jgi:hypothetical protein